MAATIVVIRDQSHWEIVHDLLSELREGGIVVPPQAAALLDRRFGTEWANYLPSVVDYDYGGQADVAVDIARADDSGRVAVGNTAYQAIVAACQQYSV